jgi:hypothetical protein
MELRFFQRVGAYWNLHSFRCSPRPGGGRSATLTCPPREIPIYGDFADVAVPARPHAHQAAALPPITRTTVYTLRWFPLAPYSGRLLAKQVHSMERMER